MKQNQTQNENTSTPSNNNNNNKTKTTPKNSNAILTPHSHNKPQTPKQGFIENDDFIRLEDPDEGVSKGNNNNKSMKNSRGIKRKLDASTIITEEQADLLRKKKGTFITPWFDKLSWKNRNVQEMLTAEIGSFVLYIQPTREEHQLREMIIQLIRKLIQSRWSDADVEPFGSFGSKLYLPGGDIDLVIISTTMMREKKGKILYKLAPLIRQSNIGQDVTIIARAKVPIIKFRTIHGNINVDISINQTNGLDSLKKVNLLLDDIKRKSSPQSLNNNSDDKSHEECIKRTVQELGAAKCLVLVIKSVLKQRGMNEVYTGGLGSYSIICLVISFLQLHPKIQSGDIDPNKNLGVLLLEFFELYGKNFNLDKAGISLRGSGSYFNKTSRGWQQERQPYLLSIEDPADESNDISKNSHNILNVRSVFSGAFDLLSATLYHRHSLQVSRRRGQSLDDNNSSSCGDNNTRPLLSVPVPKQHKSNTIHSKEEEEAGNNIGNRDPMEESLLGEIMGVTKELVEHRKKNIKLFYSGTIHRLLNISPPPSPSEKNKIPINLIEVDDPIENIGASEDDSTGSSNRKRSKVVEENLSNLQHGRRVLVQYEDFEMIESPNLQHNKTTPTESVVKKKKNKKQKRQEGQQQQQQQSSTGKKPLWIEDLEPTEVQILKRNLFTPDVKKDKFVNPGGGGVELDEHDGEDTKSPGHEEGEADGGEDSRYVSIKSCKNPMQMSYPDPSSSSSAALHINQVYVEDDEDDESDSDISFLHLHSSPNPCTNLTPLLPLKPPSKDRLDSLSKQNLWLSKAATMPTNSPPPPPSN